VAPITVASGLEARLIEAEAALHAGSTAWLTTLNTLRTNGSFTTAPSASPDSVGVIDTTWNAGTGGVSGLRPLIDPGDSPNDSARVTLLFNERAYWLFLTGQRQGDLRRLVRNYGRDPQAIYPTGPYPLGGILPQYGTGVSVQIPTTEFANPRYRGCLSQGA
jgi:hypothetical protein